MAKKIDLGAAPTRVGSIYPAPFDVPCRERSRTRLGDAAGLTQFGVNILRLQPGSWSSQRHWHSHEDEFLYVLEGEVVLVTNAGEERLVAGDCAGFRAGDPDGHHLQNRSDRELSCSKSAPAQKASTRRIIRDLDLRHDGVDFVHKDGTPYPSR